MRQASGLLARWPKPCHVHSTCYTFGTVDSTALLKVAPQGAISPHIDPLNPPDPSSPRSSSPPSHDPPSPFHNACLHALHCQSVVLPVCGAASLWCCQSVVLACLTLPICGGADEIDSASWQQQPQADMHATLMHCFLHLIREQHAQRAQLAKRSLTQALRLPFSASMPCCRSVPSTSVSQSMLPCIPTMFGRPLKLPCQSVVTHMLFASSDVIPTCSAVYSQTTPAAKGNCFWPHAVYLVWRYHAAGSQDLENKHWRP